MKITAASVEPGLREFARREAGTLERLQRALDIIYRGRKGGRSIEKITEIVLLAVAHAHEARTEDALERMNRAISRVLTDVEATRTSGGTAGLRSAAVRESDMRTIAAAVEDLMTFEDAVKKRIAEHDPGLGGLVGGLVDEADAVVRNRALNRGAEILQWADQVLDAWRSGRTLEPIGQAPLAIRDPGEPGLAATMRRLEEAQAAYRANRGGDAASATAAADRLRAEVAAANEELRSSATGFTHTSTGDVMAPRAAVQPGQSAAGTAGEAAEAIQRRLAAEPALIRGRGNAGRLLDALHFSDLAVSAPGNLREPLARNIPGVGLEKYIISPQEIGRLKSVPPGLAARLANLLDGWQRAHLVGPGFGSELFAGLMLAPWGVNQIAQNRGIEKFLRRAYAAGVDAEATIRVEGRRILVPLEGGGNFQPVDLMTSVHYEIPRKNQPPLTFDITVNPDGSWHAAHNLPPGAPGADVALAGAR